MRFWLFPALAVLCLAGAAHAQENNSATIHIEKQPGQDELYAEYNKVVAGLTAEQKAELEALAQKSVETIEPDMKIFSEAYMLMACIKAGHAKPEDEKNFLKFREAQNKLQADLIASFDKNDIGRITFMDRELLRRKLAYESVLQLKIVDGVVKASTERMPPEMLAQKCAETKKTIDAYADAPEASPDKPRGMNVQIQVPADVVENDKLYTAALAKLPSKDAEDIKKVVEYGATVTNPYIEMLVAGLRVEGWCLPRKLMDASYEDKFKKVQDHVVAKTSAAVKKYRTEVISKVTSMDPDVVDRQIMGNNIIKNKRMTAVHKAYGSIQPAIRVENECASLKGYIDTYGAKNKLF